MTFKIAGNPSATPPIANDHPTTAQTPNPATNRVEGEPYAGGSLSVKTYETDRQRDFVVRGLYQHAAAAGLPHEACVEFAEHWAADELLHQSNGKTKPYTAKEFAELKKKGVANFDLDERYSANVLSDLRQRQTAYQLSQTNAPTAPPNNASISAPQYTEAEKAFKWLTDGIQSVTGSENEIGKQFNRLSVSGLRLMGHLQELQNKATEAVGGVIRDVAPDSVDALLDKSERVNRENAQALKNANTIVTNDDRAEDLYSAKNGIKQPIAEDLHRKIMYFPEALPNAIDSAVKGDFKADDGSYSDKVGKIVGGLNPVGDVRDIVANAKNVIDGKPGSGVSLGASIIGAIPGGGDAAKPIIKEIAEELGEKTVKEIGTEGTEKLAKEEAEKLTKFEFNEVEILDKQGIPVGEFDKIEKELFVEEKSAKGLNTLHPRTGKPIQTPEQWATKQIYEKTVARIENLQNVAVSTRATQKGSQSIPSLNEIKSIRNLEFRIEGDTPELKNAVEKAVKDLSQKYPDWKFSATFGR